LQGSQRPTSLCELGKILLPKMQEMGRSKINSFFIFLFLQLGLISPELAPRGMGRNKLEVKNTLQLMATH
tara:strand:+ start:428 stop:637 length:210 start_codon:yes stop_codon:yes gene_type:complete